MSGIFYSLLPISSNPGLFSISIYILHLISTFNTPTSPTHLFLSLQTGTCKSIVTVPFYPILSFHLPSLPVNLCTLPHQRSVRCIITDGVQYKVEGFNPVVCFVVSFIWSRVWEGCVRVGFDSLKPRQQTSCGYIVQALEHLVVVRSSSIVSNDKKI